MISPSVRNKEDRPSQGRGKGVGNCPRYELGAEIGAGYRYVLLPQACRCASGGTGDPEVGAAASYALYLVWGRESVSCWGYRDWVSADLRGLVGGVSEV